MEAPDVLKVFSEPGIGGELFRKALDEPELFFSLDTELSSVLLKKVKFFSDYFVKYGFQFFYSNGCKSPELLVDNLDAEQIWQQLELDNQPFVEFCESTIEELLDTDVDLTSIITEKFKFLEKDALDESSTDDSDVDTQDFEAGSAALSEDANLESDGSSDSKDKAYDDFVDAKSRNSEPKNSKKKSLLDDEFFSVEEMNSFADEAERSGALITADASDSEGEEIYDMLYGSGSLTQASGGKQSRKLLSSDKTESITDDDGSESGEIYYDDFFEAPLDARKDSNYTDSEEDERLFMDTLDTNQMNESISHVEKSLLEDESLMVDRNLEDKEDELGLSRYSMEQRKLLEKIKKLENQALEPKHWGLRGEVDAKQRPVNSLLEAVVNYDVATKIAPQITTESTNKLEQIIKDRIDHDAFDDVIRKYEKSEHGDHRPRAAIIDDEKNSKSLAQIYEDEFIKKVHVAEEQENFKQEHVDCARLFDAICRQVDALSSMVYTPIKVREDSSIKPNANYKVLALEEVTPLTQSDALRYAPEEVYEPKVSVKGDSERTKEEKKAARRQNKKRFYNKKLSETAEKRRKNILHGSDETSGKISDAVESIVKHGSNVYIDQNTDSTQYTKSLEVFEKIQNFENNKKQH